MIAWAAKQDAGSDLADQAPGRVAGEALHALLDWEKESIVQLAKDWGQVDLSYRKLAHRGSRLEQVYMSESTVLRVLFEAGMRLPGIPPTTERRGKTPWPDWVELVPGQIFIYDFTHFAGLRGWCAIAVVDVVSRYWLSTVFAPEETWVQVETAFIAALEADGKGWLLEDAEFADQLACGQVPDSDDRVPALLAVSDNGPQMRSSNTAQFKGEHPYLDTITDPAVMRAELEVRKEHYNTIRHEGIGYVTPDHEHHGRGETIRKARRDGLRDARAHRTW